MQNERLTSDSCVFLFLLRFIRFEKEIRRTKNAINKNK